MASANLSLMLKITFDQRSRKVQSAVKFSFFVNRRGVKFKAGAGPAATRSPRTGNNVGLICSFSNSQFRDHFFFCPNPSFFLRPGLHPKFRLHGWPCSSMSKTCLSFFASLISISAFSVWRYYRKICLPTPRILFRFLWLWRCPVFLHPLRSVITGNTVLASSLSKNI